MVLGGGFGGVYTARELDRLTGGDRRFEITLISRVNYFLMTPLLFEAGSGILEPRHAVTPIRSMLQTARFVEAEVTHIDLQRKVVTFQPPGNETDEIAYDHLVLALGGVTNTRLIPGSQHAFTFKTLADAIALRNHVIQLFERADIERDPATKRALLTFVLVGGGLVNVELCGELTQFLRTLADHYPRVGYADIRVEMLDGESSIAREFHPDLRDYIARVLKNRGVNIRLDVRAREIEPGRIHLPDGTTIASETIVLGTGVTPNPLVAALPIEKDKKGRAVTDAAMLCKGQSDLWAVGDCAEIPDPSGKPYPELAQHALREAKQLARNILATVEGRPTAPFIYKTRGTLASLGHFRGAALVMGFEIRGFAAWWIWRTYYLLQMPGWSRRIRIVLDWTTGLFFKHDIVQLDLTRAQPTAVDRPAPQSAAPAAH